MATFESLFFDVRARLSQRSYILHGVIRAGTFSSNPLTVGTYALLLGYHGGPVVLDAFLDGPHPQALGGDS